MSHLTFPSRSPRAYRGSILLASCVRRIAGVLAAVAFLWGLTGWAMGWW